MKLSRIAVLAAAAAALSVNASAQGLPSQKMLPIALAQAIAQEALAKCRADGYKVTVTVVDSANALKALLRDDGATMGSVELGRMKAASVILSNGRPSGPPANLAPGALPPPPAVRGTTNSVGGVPIKAGDQLIGAVSVSGAPGGDKDASCASAGLAKVADQLK